MAASTSTVTTLPSGQLHTDCVVLTLSDGETYESRLSKPFGAFLTEANSDSTAGSAVMLDYALSGKTFTIRYKLAGSGVTDKKVALVAYGRK